MVLLHVRPENAVKVSPSKHAPRIQNESLSTSAVAWTYIYTGSDTPPNYPIISAICLTPLGPSAHADELLTQAKEIIRHID